MTDLPPPPGGPPPPPPPPPGGGGFPPPPPPPLGGWAQPSGVPGPLYASFGQRLGAYILDYLILAVPIGIIAAVLVAVLPRDDPQLCEDFEGDLAVCEPLTGASVGILLLLGLLVLVFIVYYWMGKLTGERGQTPGKKALSIKVVGKTTGQPIGMGRGIGRGLMEWLISGICLLGFLWMLWDQDNQTWHDKVADSIVVRSA